jgi:hypothetical protein
LNGPAPRRTSKFNTIENRQVMQRQSRNPQVHTIISGGIGPAQADA